MKYEIMQNNRTFDRDLLDESIVMCIGNLDVF